MAWMRRRFAVLACIVGAATLAIGLGVATGAKLKTRSASTTIGAQELDSVTAKCKKGTKAISGGFEVEFASGGGPIMLPLESMKRGGRGWESRAANFGSGAGELTSFAYCRDEKVKRRTEETTIDQLEVGTATAKCPTGTKAIAGGFAGPEIALGVDSSLILPFESRRSGKREWTVSAVNFDDFAGTLTAQAVCHEGEGLKKKAVRTTAEDNGFYDLVATCKRGSRPVSGGFDSTLPPQGEGGPFVLSSHRQGKRHWAASFFVFYTDPIPPATFTTYAYCEKKKAG
jgi:hypothetical protein